MANYTKSKKVSGDNSPVNGPISSWEQAEDQRRIKDPASARNIFDRLILDNSLRSSTYLRVRNQLEGGLPYDPAILEAQGAAWQTNCNFRDAEAARDRTLLPYWRLINDVPYKAAFKIDSRAPQASQWQVAFAEAFDDFLDEWGASYFIEYMNFASNFVNFGPGIVQWCDPYSARFEAVNVQRLYFPKNTRMMPESWDVVALVRDMSPTELYDRVKDKKSERSNKAVGWNIEAIKAAIVELSQEGGQMPDWRDYTRIADQMVNNDIAVTTPFQPVAVVWMYVKQFNGKIGCCAFTQNGGVNDFLYQSDDYAESFRHLLGAVWFNTGSDAMVHSIKGFAVKNFNYSSLINRMKSRYIDSGTMVMGMNFQYEADNHPDETPPVENFGPFTIFPDGMKQLQFYPQLQQAGLVMEMLSQNQAENNGIYRQAQQQVEDSKTATQANILAGMAGQLTEASAAIYCSQVGENIFTEQVRRLRKRGSSDPDAKKFVKRLKDKGVPEGVIFDADIRVRTGAAAGMSNPALMVQKFQSGMALASQPGVNGRWFLENYIAYLFGADAVNKALLPEGQQSAPIQRRQAIMENGDFAQGMMLPVAPEDAHVEHIEEHLPPMLAISQQAKQSSMQPGNAGQGMQISPEQLTGLAIGIEHTGQHMEMLKRDESKKAQFQQFLPVFRQVQAVARGLLVNAQKGQAQPQQQPPALPM